VKVTECDHAECFMVVKSSMAEAADCLFSKKVRKIIKILVFLCASIKKTFIFIVKNRFILKINNNCFAITFGGGKNDLFLTFYCKKRVLIIFLNWKSSN
jgi:hypothetical protein